MPPESTAQDTPATPSKISKLLVDIQTIRPIPRATVAWKGKKYEVLSIIDLPYAQMAEILGIVSEPAPEGEPKVVTTVTRTRRQLKAMVPELPDKVLDAMTYREMVVFLEATMGTGENPQKGGPTPS
jgi:hypothetical protein